MWIPVRLIGDLDPEPDESFSLSLTNPSSGAVIGQAEATAIVLNDDGFTTAEQGFFTVEPCRILDTRINGPALQPSSDLRVSVAGRCGIPLAAKAVAVNLTVTQANATGNVVLYAYGQPPPLASNVNFAAGQTRGNNAIVRLGAGGEVAVRTRQASGTIEVILDVNGYFE